MANCVRGFVSTSWTIIEDPKWATTTSETPRARFAVNFAYEEALESQPCGKHLQIPVG